MDKLPGLQGRTAIIGTGTWGTATAIALARMGSPVLLYGRDAAKVSEIARHRRHDFLPGSTIPESVVLTSAPGDLGDADLILWAVPTQFTASMAESLAAALPSGVPLVSLAKGLEEHSLRRPSEILAHFLPGRALGCLSGPSHAAEVVAGKPTCLVAAGAVTLTSLLRKRLHGQGVRLYTTTDITGVEIGGALKNVIAIAAGICDGLGLGDNIKAAVITRGVAEMRRLGRVLKAQDATFAGMAGVGDLLTSCYSPHGRNRALGLALARGENPQHYLASRRTVAEGAWTSRAAVALGGRHDVELPIASQVASVIWHDKQVAQAMDELLSRAPKEEDA